MNSQTQRNLFFGIMAASLVIFGFQNCSKVQVSDKYTEASLLEAHRIALGADQETLVAGTAPVPDLKMVFVVDNSGTMKENQLNLSSSFGSLFDTSSENSLAKFDTTAFLMSTAQRSPDLGKERAVLDSIVAKQKSFSSGLSVPETVFNSDYRTSAQNSGRLPGDNIGYQLNFDSALTRYSFLPAPVLGVVVNNGNVSFAPAVRKKATEPSSIMEADFKNRLSVLNSERIPLILTSGQYKPEHSSIVDAESGLCTVARVLRNPSAFIKSGDLLSFVLVSDENDNDPKGLNCIQSVTEFNGTEDLSDGRCMQKETTISFQNSASSKAADTCTLKGLLGYSLRYSYTKSVQTTKVTYKAVSTPAQYQVPYSTLTYQKSTPSYSHLFTDITYFTKTCVPVISDGITVGQKCSNSPAIKGSKEGDYTSNCLALAQSLNIQAINEPGYAPSCVTSYKAVSTCSSTDPLCKINSILSNVVVKDILGSLADSNACLAKAKLYADFASQGTTSCTVTQVNKSACSSAELSAGCSLIKAATYIAKTESAPGNLTLAAADCLNWAKSRSGSAATTAADITLCQFVTTPTPASADVALNFKDVGGLDSGASLAVGASCGPLAALALPKAQLAAPEVKSTDACVVLGYNKAADFNEALTTDCATQANNRCATQGLRSCSSTTNIGATTTNPSGPVVFKKVNEFISCNSKCKDSKLGLCDSNFDPEKTVFEYVQSLNVAAISCSQVTTEVAGTSEAQFAVAVANEASACPSTLTGIPRYYQRTKGPYRTQATEIDYVVGTIKDSTNKSVPASDLLSYIQKRSRELSSINPIFSALVRRASDPLGQGGSFGTDYEALIARMGGQADSVLAKDYSVTLKDLSKIIKSNLMRTFVASKMKPNQVLINVYRTPKNGSQEVRLNPSLWKQNGSSFQIDAAQDFSDGDKFRIEFQNFLE